MDLAGTVSCTGMNWGRRGRDIVCVCVSVCVREREREMVGREG